MSDIHEGILNYWFADLGDSFDVTKQHKLWYGGGDQVDREIERRFAPMVEQAVEGQLDSWVDTGTSAMALVLLLDQFTRNIYRRRAQAFAGDNRAQKIVKTAIAAGLDTQLPIVWRTFFYMPLEHSESLADQDQCVQLFEQLLLKVPIAGQTLIRSSLQFAQRHRAIIAQFGRFPHRNTILQRVSTADEVDYLASGGERFGQ